MSESRTGDRDATVVMAVQILHELLSIYRWVSNDVLGAPSILDQGYLDKLKGTGSSLEQRYRVEAARRGERVCYLNLDHPIVPHWLWVNEVMFTDFGVWVPFTVFQQRLLNQASVAPSQLHPNAWASIRCFELVTDFLQLPQEPEVFCCFFKFYSLNTSGRTKKGYMSVRPTKNRKIFTLYEDSFHDFKGRDQAGFDIAPVKYEGLNADKKDTADIFTFLFSKNNLSSKSLLGSPEESWKAIGPAPTRSLPSSLAAVSIVGAQMVPIESAGKTQVEPDGGSSTNVDERLVEISSPAGEEGPDVVGRVKGVFPMDRSFDASGFVESHLLGPRAQEIIRDCDPLESIRWAEWAMIRAATIMKSVEPHLTIADEAERQNAKLLGDAKALNQQKVALEEENEVAIRAKLRAEEDLKASNARLETLEKEKDDEINHLRRRVKELLAEVDRFRGLATEEKVRADLAEVSVSELQKQYGDLTEDAKGAVAATEGALKAQLAILVPDFDTDQINFFKDIVDGDVVDPSE
ncbi:hypothetical protein PIB30_063409 [Stylosanthes scabra]|uniref:Transposase (Putative), gypsy type n=1 Tax=Stylosanthes scabra TaxID=79078 RepID=A0ABU6RML0_9FABA|nr:hypothetical protein [Stylosanthes scabra]